MAENVAAGGVELSPSRLARVQEAADRIQIVGGRYPAELDRLANLEAPPAR